MTKGKWGQNEKLSPECIICWEPIWILNETSKIPTASQSTAAAASSLPAMASLDFLRFAANYDKSLRFNSNGWLIFGLFRLKYIINHINVHISKYVEHTVTAFESQARCVCVCAPFNSFKNMFIRYAFCLKHAASQHSNAVKTKRKKPKIYAKKKLAHKWMVKMNSWEKKRRHETETHKNIPCTSMSFRAKNDDGAFIFVPLIWWAYQEKMCYKPSFGFPAKYLRHTQIVWYFRFSFCSLHLSHSLSVFLTTFVSHSTTANG